MYTFDCWAADTSFGAGVGLVLDRGATRAWYWTMLARAGAPLVHLADPEVGLPKSGLLVRADALWADHICESPHAQWTVANEVYALELDDPHDAIAHEGGTSIPLAFDWEWYATAASTSVDGGYAQAGVVHGEIHVGREVVSLSEVPAARTHRWGRIDPVPESDGPAAGLAAPIRLPCGTYDRWLTPNGWRWWRRPPPLDGNAEPGGDARSR